MKVYYCDTFVLPLPEGHRFPMEKYSLLRSQLVRTGAIDEAQLHLPVAATRDEIAAVHEPGYVSRVFDGSLSEVEIRRIGFPWSEGLVERSRRSVGGTIGAATEAITGGFGVNLAGGTHHAFRDRGEGFCVFNDVAVAIERLRSEGLLKWATVLDLDVHQGNGTAAIFREDPNVFTLSIHGEKNFPFAKEPSDLDLALPDGAGDDQFLEAVSRGVSSAIASPSDMVFYVAGADPFVGDKLGRLAVSRAALAERDRIVFDGCEAHGLPVATVMAGGYADPVSDTVEIHFNTVSEAVRRAGQSAAHSITAPRSNL